MSKAILLIILVAALVSPASAAENNRTQTTTKTSDLDEFEGTIGSRPYPASRGTSWRFTPPGVGQAKGTEFPLQHSG